MGVSKGSPTTWTPPTQPPTDLLPAMATEQNSMHAPQPNYPATHLPAMATEYSSMFL